VDYCPLELVPALIELNVESIQLFVHEQKSLLLSNAECLIFGRFLLIEELHLCLQLGAQRFSSLDLVSGLFQLTFS